MRPGMAVKRQAWRPDRGFPHAAHQDLIRRREFPGGDRLMQALFHPRFQRFGSVLTLLFRFGHRQRQMTAQVATGKQFIIAGVLYHVINQRQNARFEFCDHQISSLNSGLWRQLRSSGYGKCSAANGGVL